MVSFQYKIGLFCLLLLMVALAACGGSSAPAPVTPGDTDLAIALPSVPQLDSLTGGGGRGASGAPHRWTSALQDQTCDVTLPLASAFGSASAGKWQFDAQASAHSWAVYKVPAPAAGSVLLSWQALGNSKLWMMVADYSTGRWIAQKMTSGQTTFDLQGAGDWTSPSDGIYCAFILPAGAASGALLSSLSLHYDDGVIPQGPQYYVSPTGNDANDGKQATPWLTLQHAADTVIAGDTVNVLPGSYTGFMLQTSGTAGNPIVFTAQPGAKIVDTNNNAVNGNGHTPDGINIETWSGPPGISYVVVDGFTINGDDFAVRPRTGIRIVGDETIPGHAHHITISNNTLLNCDEWGILTGHVDNMLIEGNECAGSKIQHGIYYSNASAHTTIRKNICHGNQACGIHSNGDLGSGGDGIISDVLFDSNIIYGNGVGGGSGINSDGVQGSTYSNNLLFDNHASGISLYIIDAADGAKNNFITNNTIIEASNGRWCLNIKGDTGSGIGSTGNTIRNNILLNDNPSHGAIEMDALSAPGFTSDYNAVTDRFTPDDGGTFQTLAQWKVSGNDTHSFVATKAQLFVIALPLVPDDFKLSAGSLALNAGGVQNAPNVDLLGNPRPKNGGYDIGCYETQ